MESEKGWYNVGKYFERKVVEMMVLEGRYADQHSLIHMRNENGSVYSVNGTVAKELGIQKTTLEMNRNERALRVANRRMTIDSKDHKGSLKLYPPEVDSSKVVRDIMVRSMARSEKGDILNKPEVVEEECLSYITYCVDNKIPPSLTDLAVWLGISREQVKRLRKSDRPVGLVLEKAADYIASIRVRQTDMGGLNPVWNMFMLANDHEFTRSDPKAALNIQINNQGYSDGELDTIIADLPLDDDF